jgi:heat shock protein HtpX
VYDLLAANKRRSIALTFAFLLFVFAVGWAFSQLVSFGPWGFAFAAVISIGGTFLSYWKSDAVALAMSHASPADPNQYARLHNLVEGLCIGSGVPKPRLYVIEDDAPNAFATGRNAKHAAIAVTTGLLAKMDRLELEAVLAHELAHVKNNDILVSTLAVTMVGIVALLADIGMRFLYWGGPRHRNDRNSNDGGIGAIIAVFAMVLLVFAPIIARLMQFAISRKREELADITGVSITKYPPGLISALEKLRDDQTVVHSASKATAHLWIESPIGRNVDELRERREGSKTAWLNRLFDTHPPLEQRIAALREL